MVAEPGLCLDDLGSTNIDLFCGQLGHHVSSHYMTCDFESFGDSYTQPPGQRCSEYRKYKATFHGATFHGTPAGTSQQPAPAATAHGVAAPKALLFFLSVLFCTNVPAGRARTETNARNRE